MTPVIVSVTQGLEGTGMRRTVRVRIGTVELPPRALQDGCGLGRVLRRALRAQAQEVRP